MVLDSNKIESIKAYFKTRPVLRACLFGLYIKRIVDGKSDLDILANLDYMQKTGLKFMQTKIDLERILHNKVDLVPSHSMSKYY